MPASWFDDAYLETPPWDSGRPQPAIVELAENGRVTGVVLDVGCGTGENTLYLAAHGYHAVGIDGAPRAIAKARRKARARGVSVDFEVADALDLPIPDTPFDTVIDSGLFHVFSDEERLAFRGSLERVIRPGGTYFMMCFSDQQPGNWGPRRLTQSEIGQVFSDGWWVDSIEASAFETNVGPAHAWLASITRKSAPR